MPNTDAAQKARRGAKDGASKEADGGDADGEAASQTDGGDKPEDASPKRGTKHKRDEEGDTEEKGETNEEVDTNGKAGEEAPQSQPPAKQAKGEDGEKRTTRSKSKGEKESPDANEEGESEKKGDDEHGQPASASRLPKEGQHVFWRATPGWVEGTSH